MTPQKFKEVKKVLLWVKDQILAHPRKYNQGEWCGSACCIAGWIDHKISGPRKENDPGAVHKAATKFLTGSEEIEPFLKNRGKLLFDASILESPVDGRPQAGTMAHARAGARVIDAYLEQEEFSVSMD